MRWYSSRIIWKLNRYCVVLITQLCICFLSRLCSYTLRRKSRNCSILSNRTSNFMCKSHFAIYICKWGFISIVCLYYVILMWPKQDSRTHWSCSSFWNCWTWLEILIKYFLNKQVRSCSKGLQTYILQICLWIFRVRNI